MARPTSPLVTRDSAARAALDLIDEKGLDAFSLPGLARLMGVSTPALYHHFADKADVLAEVARLVIAEATRPPFPEDVSLWHEWSVESSLSVRAAVLRHRNAAPVLLQFPPRDLVAQRYDEAAGFFERAGVPAHLHIELMDGIEKLTLGGTLVEAMRPEDKVEEIFPVDDPGEFPALAAAKAANRLSATRLHSELILAFIRGVAGP